MQISISGNNWIIVIMAIRNGEGDVLETSRRCGDESTTLRKTDYMVK